MKQNRAQRRAADAIAKKGGNKPLPADFGVCGLGDCKARAVATYSRGSVFGTFCLSCIDSLRAAEQTLRMRKQAEALAALPLWRRMFVRLYLAFMAWRVRRAAKALTARVSDPAPSKEAP